MKMFETEEYFMDFEAEETQPQFTQLDFEDVPSECSTLSASEIDDDTDKVPTFVYKLKKARVLLKKLPRDVLAKYKISSKGSSIGLQPSRSSGRLKSKQIPVGRYMALHKNKVIKKEKMQKIKKNVNSKIQKLSLAERKRFLSDYSSRGSMKIPLRSINPYRNSLREKKQSSSTFTKKNLGLKNPYRASLHQKKLYSSDYNSSSSENNSLTSTISYKASDQFTSFDDSSNSSENTTFGSKNSYKAAPSTSKYKSSSKLSDTTVLNKKNTSSAYINRSLQERINATRIKTKPIETPVPNFPDVVITRYDMPPTSRNHSTLCTATGNETLLNSETSISDTPKYSHAESVQSKVFPALIASAYPAKQNCQNVTSNAAATTSIDSMHRSTEPIPRKFSIQAFKVPNDLSQSNSLVPVDSPKVFIVNNSSIERDPLDTPISQAKNTEPAEKQFVNLNTLSNNKIGLRVRDDSYLKQTENVEKIIEPEVLKRVIYNTKSVQTKFTCNSSICGLVDTDGFNLNCFYCYDTFPLHKWYEFKEHIKVVHHVEESVNQKHTDAYNYKAYPQKSVEKGSQHVNLPTRNMPENNRGNFIRNPPNTTDQVYKKLPLEPKLIAQRLNKINSRPNILKSSTPKICKPSQIQNQSLPTSTSSNIQRQNKFIAQPPTLSSSTPKICKPSQIENQSLPTSTSSNSQSQINFIAQPPTLSSSTPKICKPSQIENQSLPTSTFNYSQIDDIISIGSDDCDLDLGDIDNIQNSPKKPQQSENKPANKTPQTNNAVSQDNNTKLVLPYLPHLTIKKVMKAQEVIDLTSTASESMASKENFKKIPSTASVQKVIKTLPKTTTNQLSDNVKTRPRYFVVKKVIQLPKSDQTPDLNISKGTILTKCQLESLKKNTGVNKESTVKVKNIIRKTTNGVGILFGITSSVVVIEFLLKLKTFPELWCFGSKTTDPVKYNESVKKLCSLMNNRFKLNMTEFEMLLSIQRVKDWYYLMLQNIHEHKKDPSKTEPYKHRFPTYFNILKQYLTPDADEIVNKTNLNENLSQPPIVSTTTPDIVPNNKDDSQNAEMTADSLIEFDGDILYDLESSDEEVLEEFDETSIFFKKPRKKLNPLKPDGTPRSRTKIYRGSFECDVCHKIYKRRCDLKRHRVHHFPPQFECGVCSQKFYLKHWADKCSHTKNKTCAKYRKVDKTSGEKRIWPKKIFRFNMICEICGNSYRSIGSLNTHKRDKHFNQRNRCIVCNFTALSNWRIVQHQRKRHIVEPGLPEDVAKKSRARTETKTTFSNEARQAFDWRREMRKNMNPGEKFYGCCRCKIVFHTRKEKVLHNKIEHPITEFTVVCLLCLPTNLILATANSARRHYTVTHKVPWHEIDALVKNTKPIFNFLNKEEIELLKASENYKELLDELLKDKKLYMTKHDEDEVSKAVGNLTYKNELSEEGAKIEVEYSNEENVCVDSIKDQAHNDENIYKQSGCASLYEHNYSEDHAVYNINENCNDFGLYSQQSCEEGAVSMDCPVESSDNIIQNNDQVYVQNIIEEYVDGELIEESIVIEEYIDEDIEGEQFIQI